MKRSSFDFLEAGVVMHVRRETADFVCPSHPFNLNSSVKVFMVKNTDLQNGLPLSRELELSFPCEGELCFLTLCFSYLLLHNKNTPNLSVLKQQFVLIVPIGQESGCSLAESYGSESLIGCNQKVSPGPRSFLHSRWIPSPRSLTWLWMGPRPLLTVGQSSGPWHRVGVSIGFITTWQFASSKWHPITFTSLLISRKWLGSAHTQHTQGSGLHKVRSWEARTVGYRLRICLRHPRNEIPIFPPV